MADIDMIPRSYREARRVRRLLGRYGVALGALLVVGAGAAGLLRWQVAHTEPQLTRLRADGASAGGDSARLAAILARQAALEQGVAALSGLRGAGSAGRLSEAIEQSLRADLWLVGIHYVRSEQRLPEPATDAGRPGDLSVRSAAGAQERWRVTRRVNFTGAAFSYPALTEFMRSFAGRDGVVEVRLVDSRAPDDAGAGAVAGAAAGAAVGFEMTALVDAAGVKP
jgi:hypothetical protein